MQTHVLSKVPLFSTLAPRELELLAASSKVVQYRKHYTVFHEGDPGDSLLVILKGRVKVMLLGDEGRETLINELGPLSYLGEVALLDDAPRSATVVTLEPSEFLRISREPFRAMLREHPPMAFKIMVQLAAALRRTTEQIRTLTLFDLHGRVLRALMLRAQAADGGSTRAIVRPRPSATELASMIGCSRETVSRALSTLLKCGYLRAIDGGLTIEPLAFRRYLPATLPGQALVEVQ